MALVFGSIPFFVASALAVALAVVVFRQGPGRPRHRALAAYLFVRGLAFFAVAMYSLGFDPTGSDSPTGRSWGQVDRYLLTAAYVLAIPVALAWRRPEAAGLGTRPEPYLAGVVLAFVVDE